MALAGNIVINCYSAVLLLIVYLQNTRHRERLTLDNRLYIAMIHVGMIMLVLDVLSRLDGKSHWLFPILNPIGNAAVFLLTPLLPSLWMLYAHHEIFRSKTKLRRLLWPLTAVFAGHAGLTVASFFTGWFYRIDADNVYQRGPWYFVSVSIPILLLLFAFFMILRHRHLIEKRHFFPLVFFAVPPFIAILLQGLFYGMSLMLNAAALSLLIIYLNIQSISLHTDYLTGINNRLRLQQYMQEKIDASVPGNSFAAILLDFDNFKSINDRLGHSVGDEALTTAAKLMSGNLRPQDFLARYGGDEFCIVLDLSCPQELEQIAQRLQTEIRDFNAQTTLPYRLNFSMGYAVYDPQSGLKLKEFQQLIDQKMYAHKHERKHQTEYLNSTVSSKG